MFGGGCLVIRFGGRGEDEEPFGDTGGDWR